MKALPLFAKEELVVPSFLYVTDSLTISAFLATSYDSL